MPSPRLQLAATVLREKVQLRIIREQSFFWKYFWTVFVCSLKQTKIFLDMFLDSFCLLIKPPHTLRLFTPNKHVSSPSAENFWCHWGKAERLLFYQVVIHLYRSLAV